MPPSRRRVSSPKRVWRGKELADIRRFTKVGKPESPAICSSIAPDETKPLERCVDSKDITSDTAMSGLKKRKAEGHNALDTSKDIAMHNSSPKKRKPNDFDAPDSKTVKGPQTPQKPRSNLQLLPSPESTPTKLRSVSEDEAGIQISSSSRVKTTSNAKNYANHVYDTPPATPRLQKSQPTVSKLPAALQELVQINNCLLKALSLQFAHHGTTHPVDVRILCPSVSKIWGKRRITTEDIRRVLGLYGSECGLDLLDYSRGKICIEIRHGEREGSNKGFREERLKQQFLSELWIAWQRWTINCDEENGESSTVDFVKGFALSKVLPCSSLKRAGSPLAEGQRRLEDLKFVAREAQSEEVAKACIGRERSAALGIKHRSHGLLERLKAKEQLRATLPAPPSKAQSDRRAALQRMHDVVSILCPPSSGNQRKTQSLSSVVQNVQNSSRSAVSKLEVQLCLTLLAEEVASDFLSLVKSGDVTAVVINQGCRPGDLDARVEQALNRA